MAKIPINIRSDLRAILQNLTFEENFRSIIQTIELTSGSETEIPNPFSDNIIPRYYVVYGKDIAGDVYDGTTAWTSSNLYINTTAAATQTVKIGFYI